MILGLVGHRVIPDNDQSILKLARQLVAKSLTNGDTWLSGGALGIDKLVEDAYYETLFAKLNPCATVFLPYDGFNGITEMRDTGLYYNVKCHPKYKLAERLARDVYALYNPTAKSAPDWVITMMTRNVFEICGQNFPCLDKSVSALFCYAKPIMKGERLVDGGTNLAVLLAVILDIPVYNLWYPDTRAAVSAYLDGNVDLLQLLSLGNPIFTGNVRGNTPEGQFMAKYGLTYNHPEIME